jgi:hypothetical protein
VTLADFDLDAAALTAAAGVASVRLATPETGEGAVMLGGGAEAMADRVAAIIRDQVAS